MKGKGRKKRPAGTGRKPGYHTRAALKGKAKPGGGKIFQATSI
jgi:hypothetical protein